MRISVSNAVFFATVGFLGDTLNFTAVQSEIFLAAGIFKATELQLGVLGFLVSGGYAIMTLLAGLLSEQIGRRPLCTFGATGLLISYLLTPHVQTFTQLCAVCFIRSNFSAFLWVPLMAWMARAENHHGLQRLLRKYNVSWSIGILTGFFIAGIVYTTFGWRSGFHVSAALAFILVLFIAICEPHGGTGAPAGEDEETTHGLEAHQVRHFVRQGFLMLTAGTFLMSLIVYLFPKVGGDVVHERAQSILNVLRLAGQTVMFYIFGHTTRWHYRRWPLLLCAGSMAAGVAMVASVHHYALYAIGFAMTGAGFGVAFTMSAFYALSLSEVKGKGSGMMETLVGGGSLLGPLYGGAIGAYLGPRVGVFAGLLPLAFLFLWAMIKPAAIKRTEAEQASSLAA
jgi:MFS family permease